MALGEHVGTVYVRAPFRVGLPINGIYDLLWAKFIPAFVVPDRYWMKCRSVGAGGVALASHVNQNIIGVYGDGAESSHFPSSANLKGVDIKAAAQSLAQDANQFQNSQEAATITSQDILGFEDSAKVIGDGNHIFERNTEYGLPDRGTLYFDGTDLKMVPMDYFSTDGHISQRNRDVERTGLVAWLATTNTPAYGSVLTRMAAGITTDDSAAGDSAMNALYNAMHDRMTDTDNINHGLPTALDSWMTYGFGESYTETETVMWLTGSVTLQCQVFDGATNKWLTAV